MCFVRRVHVPEDIQFWDSMVGEINSRAVLQEHLSQANGVMAEVSQRIEHKAISGNIVFFRWVHEGLNAVTGKRYTFPGCTFLRFSEGTVVEHRDYFDPKILVDQFKQAHKAKKAESNL